LRATIPAFYMILHNFSYTEKRRGVQAGQDGLNYWQTRSATDPYITEINYK